MTTHILNMQLNKENPTDVMETSCVFFLIQLTSPLEVTSLFTSGELDIYHLLFLECFVLLLHLYLCIYMKTCIYS